MNSNLAIVVTSNDRILNGQFQRFLDSAPPNLAIAVALRGKFDSNLGIEPSNFEVFLEIDENSSLSKSRNLLLDELDLNQYFMICFPDDDCWYPRGLIPQVETILQHADYVIGQVSYGLEIDQITIIPNHVSRTISNDLILKNASSASVFLKPHSIKNFEFDLELGVGAKHKAGEDIDLILTIFHRGSVGVLCSDLKVNHPYRDKNEEYFVASIAALKNHTHIKSTFIFIFRRTIRTLLEIARGHLSLKVSLNLLCALLKKPRNICHYQL